MTGKKESKSKSKSKKVKDSSRKIRERSVGRKGGNRIHVWANTRDGIFGGGYILACAQRLAKRHPRAFGVHPCSNVHGSKLLEEQLGRVRDVNLRDLVLVLAGPAFVVALFEFAITQKLVISRGSSKNKGRDKE